LYAGISVVDTDTTYSHLSNFTNDQGYWNSTFALFNKTYADGLYAGISVVGDNSSWNESWADTLYAVSGYGDNWNKTYADTLYADVSVTGDNSSWNESWADGLYAGIEWDYNQTVSSNAYIDTQINAINTTTNIDSLGYLNKSGANANQDVNISPYNLQAGNLTLTQKITFLLGEIIDNIVDGWITITGSLNVTGDITTTGNVSASYFIGNGSLLTGVTGANGSAGADGEGVIAGGTTGQVLQKASDVDFDMEWANFTDGGYTYFAVWAEESATIAAGNTEYAYGNGDETPLTSGIVIGVDSELFAVGGENEAGTGVNLEVIQNGVSVAETGVFSSNTLTVLGTTVNFTAGDLVNFRTKAVTSSGASCRPVAWFRVAVKGEKGDAGVAGADGADGVAGADGDMTWNGTWSAGTYLQNAVVEKDGSSYVCNAVSTTETPSGSATDWDLMASIGSTGLAGFSGGWSNSSTETNTSLVVNVNNNLTVSGTITGITASSLNVFQAALSSTTQDTNDAAGYNHTWTSTVKDTDYVTYTNGQKNIVLAAGEYNIAFGIVVLDATANDRSIWALYLDHFDSGGSSVYEYLAGVSYLRDDAATYDSGGLAENMRLVVSEGEQIIIRSKQIDSQDATDDNPADQTQSRIKIDRITYS